MFGAEYAWSRGEQERLKACTKALLFSAPELLPRLGRFVLIRQIGRGAHGAVYEANDLQSGGRVALKTLRRADAAGVAAFKREFRVLAGIAHDNLVALHELFADDEWYFTMELVEGVDFSAYVREGDAGHGADCARLRRAFAALAGAVAAIHRAGKLHCDLKPSNVRVTREGRVIVLDYGLVSSGCAVAPALGGGRDDAAVDVVPDGGALRGTPEYMAPELLAGRAPSPASDVYALGVMLFVSLTGRLPYPRRNDAELSVAERGTPLRPSQHTSDVPPDLDALCAAMLACDPASRPNLEEVLLELGTAHASDASEARASGFDATIPASAGATFLGREAELSLLHRALADAHGERPIALFVSGASGIGKSALLDRFVAQIAERTRVFVGRCYEREALPYKAFDDIVGALARWLQSLPAGELAALVPRHAGALVRVFPALERVPGFHARPEDLDSVDRQELRQQAFVALKQLLGQLTRHEPIVLVMDDLQWGDLDSARLLLELLGGPAAPRLLCIGCHRSGEEQHSEFLSALHASAAPAHALWEQRQLALAALEPAACAELAKQLLAGGGAISGARFAGEAAAELERIAARVAREAAGVPIFVCELARHFASAREPLDTALPLSALLQRRMEGAPEDARRALSLLALAARPVPAGLLARALAHERWRRSLHVLQVAGLARSDASGAWLTYHDRIRELCVERLSAAERSALHAVLARAYEREPHVELEWLIEHWRAAGEGARALEYAVLAAAAASEKLAFNRAAELYRAALELVGDDDARVAGLHEQLGDALANAGRGREAADAFLLAAAAAGGEHAFTLRCRAAQQKLRSSNTEAAIELVEQLLGEIRIPYPHGRFALAGSWLRARALVALRSALVEAAPALRGGNFVSAPAPGAGHRPRIEALRALFREYSVFDPVRGMLFQQLFYAEALRARDEHAMFIGLAWDSYNRAFVGGKRGSRRSNQRLARLERAAARLQTPYAQATVWLMRAACALFEGKYAQVETPAARAAEIFGAQCVGAGWEESVCWNLRYTSHEITGPIRKLGQSLPALIRRSTERGDRFSDASVTMAMTLALLANDEPDNAWAFIQERGARERPHLAFPRFFQENRVVDCLRYAGHGLQAWQRWQALWPSYARSMYRRVEVARSMMHHQRARCALAAAAAAGGDRELLRIAEREAAIVERVGRPESPAHAAATRSAVAAQRGDLALARSLLAGALEIAERTAIWAYAACYRWQLARLHEGAAGGPLTDAADQALREDGIVNPARWVEVYAPGYEPRRAIG